MGKKKRAAKVRKAQEFSAARLRRPPRPPVLPSRAYSWELPAIMDARDAQIRGQFRTPVQLATSMRTDDAIFVARRNRLAPLRCLGIQITPGKGPRAGAIAGEADALFGQDGIAISRETVASINGDLADHAIAIGYNDWTVRDDGSRTDLVHHIWPLELVHWDANRRQLLTQVEPGTEPDGGHSSVLQPIVHGDGTWVVYRTHELNPWQQDAAILDAAMIWAGHAFAMRDWSKGSASHGNAKVIGTLPEGSNLQEADDEGVLALTTECESMLDVVEDISGQDQPSAVKPFGSEVDYVMNTSRAWEVWERLGTNRERAAARTYLGTDGTLGSMGGAPGVDIAQLFGVATTIVQGDITAIETGVRTGVMEPWGAVNHGDSSQVPKRSYKIVDPDEQRVAEEDQKRRDETAKNRTAFFVDLSNMRESGMVVDQSTVAKLAKAYGVDPPQLSAVTSAKKPSVALAPTDVVEVVRVDEARASADLEPTGTMDGQLFVSEFKAKNAARQAAAEAEAQAKADIGVEKAAEESDGSNGQTRPAVG